MTEVRPKGYVKHFDWIINTCDSCKHMKWIGGGSRNQQKTMCTKVEPNFQVYLEDKCDEFEEPSDK